MADSSTMTMTDIKRSPVVSLREVMDEQYAEKFSEVPVSNNMDSGPPPVPHTSAWANPPEITCDPPPPDLPNLLDENLSTMIGMGLDPEACGIALSITEQLEDAISLCLEQDLTQLKLLAPQKPTHEEKVAGSVPPPADQVENMPNELEPQVVVQQTGSGAELNAETEVVDTDEDLALALALQEQEKREYQASLQAQRQNAGNQHVTVVRQLYSAEDSALLEADIAADEDAGEEEDWEEEDEGGDSPQLEVMSGPGRGRHRGDVIQLADGSWISKHDPTLCGRQNASSLADHYQVGDLDADSVILNNRATNSLRENLRKKQSIKGQTAHGRVGGETRQTRGGVLDQTTEMLLFKLQNQGLLEEIHGVVKTGKEAHILYAKGRLEVEGVPGEGGQPLAVKVFKTTLNKFGNRADYIDGDARYGNLRFNKQGRRTMFKLWAEKEHRNLLRAYVAGVSCPEPARHLEHILVMRFVGKDGWPAPQLKEMELSATGGRRTYIQVLEECRKLFHDAALIHGDLSEYNILYKNKQVVLIDFGQAVERTHPEAYTYLERDISSINRFFSGKQVKILPTDVAIHFILNCRVVGVDILEKALKWDQEANLKWNPSASLNEYTDQLLLEEGGIQTIMSPEEIQQSLDFALMKRNTRDGDLDSSASSHGSCPL